jgi:trehalose 6-phosphate phosphatase
MMKNILEPKQAAVLRRWLGDRCLLVFDYDGTLSPIALRPTEASLPAPTSRILSELARKYPCALVTGRSRRDIAPRVKGVPFVAIIGNHGAEWRPPLRGFVRERRLVRAWVRELRAELGGIPKLGIESKGLTLSVHWRAVPRPARYLSRISGAVCSLPDSRLIRGKKVFNLAPRTLPDKGYAVQRLMQVHRSHRAIYLGDDQTDEDVFRLRNRRILGIHVGGTPSAAPYYLRTQRQIDRFLRGLLPRVT